MADSKYTTSKWLNENGCNELLEEAFFDISLNHKYFGVIISEMLKDASNDGYLDEIFHPVIDNVEIDKMPDLDDLENIQVISEIDSVTSLYATFESDVTVTFNIPEKEFESDDESENWSDFLNSKFQRDFEFYEDGHSEKTCSGEKFEVYLNIKDSKITELSILHNPSFIIADENE